MAESLRVGSRVLVPWGLSRQVPGTVVEVWGDPPTHVRVHLHFDDRGDDLDEVVLLLSPGWLIPVGDGTALPSSA